MEIATMNAYSFLVDLDNGTISKYKLEKETDDFRVYKAIRLGSEITLQVYNEYYDIK